MYPLYPLINKFAVLWCAAKKSLDRHVYNSKSLRDDVAPS